ncbi:flavin reductase [Anaplasmataceae bacterium AB001_6]|nr:flavin reductase [Anaplasmataceae bacterium AB001_6]
MENDTMFFRRCLAKFPVGVAVIAGLNEGNPWGITVGSFNAVSLEPKLVLFSIENTAHRLQYITMGSSFTISVLNYKQVDVAKIFAGHDASKWPDKLISIGKTDCIVKKSSAYFDCTTYRMYEGGDHTIVVGNVKICDYFPDRKSLVFYEGKYNSL